MISSRLLSGALLCTGALFTRIAGAVEDPGVAGPHAVTVTQYGSNSTSISLGEIPTIEVLAQVHYPTDLANGPYPLVVFMHGRHTTCYTVATGAASGGWPCGAGDTAVPSYKGYDYIASLLASHGMIVASISANGINAVDNFTSTLGMDERGALIQYHLGKWNTFSTVGASPFGTTFVGHVDLQRVGTMGHSRGGEGVIWNFERNLAAGSPYGIRAVLPLAPVDFYGHYITQVPVAVMLPYCDGDVYDLPGVAYFDDARYAVSGDQAAKYTILAMGANHNYFNRNWTPDQFAPASFDDWPNHDENQTDPHCNTSVPGNARLTSAKQRAFGAAYMSAFFRRHLLGATQFDAILNRDAPPPASAQTTAVYTAFLPGESDRKDLNRLSISAETSENTLGGAVGGSGITADLCGDWTGLHCVSAREPHFNSLSALDIGWTSTSAVYSNALPTFKQDVSNFSTLQFRLAVDYSDAKNAVGQAQNLSVRLVDGLGHSSTVALSAYSAILYYPPAGVSHRATVMNTVRIPMSAFAAVDRTNVVSVDLVLDKKATGSVFASDFAFSGEGMTLAEQWLVAKSI